MSDRESWMEPLEEIWEIRRRLLAEFDNDLSRYVAHLIELQEQEPYRDRLISKSGKRPGKGKSAA
jgi:hypothetical protein